MYKRQSWWRDPGSNIRRRWDNLPPVSYTHLDVYKRQGNHLYPALPYAAYNKMVPQDVANLKAFMDTLPASAEPSKPHEVSFPFNIRRNLGIWKRMFVNSDWVIQGDLTPEQTRGRYIAEAMAHCGECHTPRNALGGMQTGKWLSGAANPNGKGKTPNITPAKLTWTQADIVEYLTLSLIHI